MLISRDCTPKVMDFVLESLVSNVPLTLCCNKKVWMCMEICAQATSFNKAVSARRKFLKMILLY
jgi:hypothetical protein